MDFYIDIGAAVMLRLLKDRRQVQKYRALFVKLAAAILTAFENDAQFDTEVKTKANRG